MNVEKLAALALEAAELLEGCPDDDVADDCARRLRTAAAESVPPKAPSFVSVPTWPGRWFWQEWNCEVDVYKKKGGKHLYVTPPGGLEVRVTPKIAGGWIAVPTTSPSSSDAGAQRDTDRKPRTRNKRSNT